MIRRNIKKYLVNEEEKLVLPQYAVSIKKIRRICAYTSQITTKDWRPNTPYPGDINTPYSQYSNKIFWKISNMVLTPRNPQYAETAMYGKSGIKKYDTGTIDLLTTEIPSYRISFDESDDEDYMVIYDKNSFSNKIISVNDLKTDSENNNDKVNMPSFPSPEPMVSYFNDLDYFKDFENEFLAIVYNDALKSKLDFLTEPTLSPQYIDEFNLKDETSLSECDKEEQNVLNFNDLFPFNVIYPKDSKSDKDNDDDKVDIEHSSGDLSVKPLPDVINIDVGAYAHGACRETTQNVFSTFIESAFPDCLYGISKPHGYGVLTIWTVSSLYFQHSLYDIFIKRIQRIQVSIRRILGNGYGISTSCTVLGPHEGKSTNVGGEFIKSGDPEVLES
ncbi:hypothetical protein Tco_0773585 [Tanacetum coccineum]|uniref:Uncharacterized protein n=1 Tax=Tanacetum coccineum TaxID=301880 RepID=A0ABQ4ZL39_9ASTR